MAIVAMGELKEINLAPQTEMEDVQQCLSMILNTPRGTVPFMRDFGLSTSYLHRPTRGDINTIAADVADQIEAYETRIEAEDIFSAEERIRNIFLEKETLPNIMLCVNSVYTRCAYQAVVDYNLVGQIQIIGYFANDTIMDAVDKQVIFSTISVDTQEMGKSCIQALYEYNNMGYTNSYLPVGVEVVNQEKAHRIISEKSDKVEQ